MGPRRVLALASILAAGTSLGAWTATAIIALAASTPGPAIAPPQVDAQVLSGAAIGLALAVLPAARLCRRQNGLA